MIQKPNQFASKLQAAYYAELLNLQGYTSNDFRLRRVSVQNKNMGQNLTTIVNNTVALTQMEHREIQYFGGFPSIFASILGEKVDAEPGMYVTPEAIANYIFGGEQQQ